MLSIAICDTTLQACREIESAIQKHLTFPTDIEIFDHAEAFLASMRTDRYRPQIAVLELGMEVISAIELASEINRLVPECRIIFISMSDEYNPEVYRTEHVWCFPRSRMNRFMKPALDKAVLTLQQDKADESRLILERRGKRILIPAADVIYLERTAHQTVVVTVRDEYRIRKRPEEILASDAEGRFVHCHQSYWVNRFYIRELVKETFILENGISISIGRTYRKEAREAFIKQGNSD